MDRIDPSRRAARPPWSRCFYQFLCVVAGCRISSSSSYVHKKMVQNGRPSVVTTVTFWPMYACTIPVDCRLLRLDGANVLSVVWGLRRAFSRRAMGFFRGQKNSFPKKKNSPCQKFYVGICTMCIASHRLLRITNKSTINHGMPPGVKGDACYHNKG